MTWLAFNPEYMYIDDIPENETPVPLPTLSPLEEVVADYRTQGLSLRDHPVKFMRSRLVELRAISAAAEADRIGLVSRVVPHEDLMKVAMQTAETIGSYGIPALLACKEMVARADELGVSEGLRFEQRLFYGLFGTEDQKEGMAAFVEKRTPAFKDK